MMLQDDVYGSEFIDHPLLLDLLESDAVRRLAEVSQAGASSLIRKGRSVTRLEHSIGVLILTRRLGGSILEQAAALLHDVSHTAFSHTIDHVFGDRKQQFHDEILDSVVAASDLPKTLRRHQLSWPKVFSPKNIRRVDAPAPLLCADRIDYTLRDLLRFGHISKNSVDEFLNSIEFTQDQIVCNSIDQAAAFAEWYRFLVEHLFMNPLELYAHDEFSRILAQGIRLGVIDETDLLSTDAVVLDKLMAQAELRARLDQMLETTHVVVGDLPGSRRVYSKARIVDPPVLWNGEIRSLSQLKPGFSKIWGSIELVGMEGLLVVKQPANAIMEDGTRQRSFQ